MFVKAVVGELRTLGIGKLLAQNGADCTVEYFDAPMSDPVLKDCLATELRTLHLPAQTRVYFFNTGIGAWEIGRVLDDHGDSQLVKFPNNRTLHLRAAEIFVRWDRPIVDPTPFLAARINETPRFTDGRAPFVRSMLRQRSASFGMSALPSSAIDLEAHQVEVVRQVLQDPIQRYLLADEVGLGKTIEAGVLIRQCVLDDRERAVVVVIVPDALVSQWQLELTSKFFLGDRLDKTIFIEPFSARRRIKAHLPSATMLVIDEAHHLTTDIGSEAVALYDELVDGTTGIERILLLSATPALHNERGFLRMLHLLDPRGYPLDGEEAFRKRVADRQELAAIVASLNPDNALYLDGALDRLNEMFPEDRLLQEQVDILRDVIIGIPAADDPELVAAISLVRNHLSEIYRLHRRVLRHRRRNVVGLTPDRSGADVIPYPSAAARRAVEAADDWRFEEITNDDPAMSREATVDASWTLSERRAVYAIGSDAGAIDTAETPPPGGSVSFRRAVSAMDVSERASDRIDALVAAVEKFFAPKVQFIVFCSDPLTADEVAKALAARLKKPIDRHDPDDDSWRAFSDAANRPVLVCDFRAEEGLNLQGGEKIVVHYDLPWNPNRIEQRLGRADRYGSGKPVKSLVLCCEDDPQEIAWTRYLQEALRVFDRSIASLQYLIEETVQRLPSLLLTEGAEGILDLFAQDQGERGRIEREIESINQQDALDSLEEPPLDALDALANVDAEWRQIESDLSGWIQTTLMFGRADEPNGSNPTPGDPFRYYYATGNRHTLVPLEAFYQECKSAIDLGVRVQGSKDAWTVPYTYSRRSASSRQGRLVRARLLRYGDPFLSGLAEITQRDERGRSTAFWRYVPTSSRKDAGLHLRFDFVVEADLEPARKFMAGDPVRDAAALSCLGRRGDMALSPFFHTMWLDPGFHVVRDLALLAELEQPFRFEAGGQGGRDFNLNARRWQALQSLGLPQMGEWSDICLSARVAAEERLRSLPALNEGLDSAARVASSLDAGRLGLLQARSVREGAKNTNDERDLHLERALSAHLIAGIRSPRVTLDAVCACFLGSDMAIATALARI